MRNGRKFGLLIAVLVVVGVMASPALAAAKSMTVGDLYVKIAEAKGLRPADSTSAEASLRKAGFDLPRLDRAKSLTEGDVAAISSAVGVRVATSNPTAAFGSARADRFVTTMSSELASGSGRLSAGADSDRVSTESSDSGSGKGKKKPKSKSPKKPKKPKPPKPPKS